MEDMHQTIIQALQYRHACKQFDPKKKVSTQDFQTILEAGRLSPSSFGFEPWRFLVVMNDGLKKKLYPRAWGAQKSLDGASHFIILLARRKIDTLHGSAYIDHIMHDIQHFPEDVAKTRKTTFASWQEHDFCLTVSDRAIFDWACKQTYIALANMLTAAAMLRVDSCPIEGFNREAVEHILVDEGVMDPIHFGVSVMAGFGYRAADPKRPKTRQKMNDVVQWIE